ncbi:MAG: fumarate hydratase C-terminal domain-containing protein, partial [Ruminococcus sp.]|nr:fumarate hydratase C-terminal domain-containing protein [Ruminococcus sp.]
MFLLNCNACYNPLTLSQHFLDSVGANPRVRQAAFTARLRHAVAGVSLQTKRFNRRIGCNVTLPDWVQRHAAEATLHSTLHSQLSTLTQKRSKPMTKHITLPLTEDTIQDLHAGDSVLLSGTVITGRDAAHKRLFELIEKGEPLPVSVSGETIYYVGPAPAKPGYVVGPAGPTSSYRMDKFTPALL